MPGRSKSSHRWLQRQSKDQYFKQAKDLGLRSRAAIKLQQLDQKHRLFSAGMKVLDLGATPGGWSQYAASRVGSSGQIIAVDITPMTPIEGVKWIHGDIFEAKTISKIKQLLGNAPLDIVISDMSPNITGMAVVDMPKILSLAEAALDIAKQVLSGDGVFLVKVFQGAGIDEYRSELKSHFSSVAACKPSASRSESGEIYVLSRKRVK